MENVENTKAVSASTKQIITQIINAWHAQNKAVTTFLNKHPDNVYLNEVAPGRNRGIYILGHLTAVNDSLLTMFGLGEKLYPQLETTFLSEADNAAAVIPSVAELKQYWETVITTLTNHFNKMEPHEWLERHTKVSEADFALEPTRNKLNVLISRTNHQSYHLGQLNFLTPRVAKKI